MDSVDGVTDVCIRRFRDLTGLMLVHGRNNYVRTSFLVSFWVFKNIVFTVPIYCMFFFTGGTVVQPSIGLPFQVRIFKFRELSAVVPLQS